MSTCVECGHTNPVAALADPNSPEVADAKSRRCVQCKAVVGKLCINLPIDRGPLVGRLVHHVRCLPEVKGEK